MMRALGILLLTLAAAVFPAQILAQTNEQNETFAKAYALYANGKSAEARELFEKTLETRFRLIDYSLYYLGGIHFNGSNWDTARQVLSQLKQKYPQSIWLQPATLLQAKIDIAEKKYAQAGATLRQIRAEKTEPREITDEALYLQAQIQENRGDPSRAHALYDELRNKSPNSRWTAPARNAQARLREAFPELFAFHTIESLANDADRLARERQSGDAEVLDKKILNNVTDTDLRARFLAKLAGLYLSTGNRNDAIPILEQIAREFPDSAETPKALYQIGQILWNRHENSQALGYFKQVLEKYPGSDYVDRAQFAAADIHEFFGRKEEAIQLYNSVIRQFPKSQVRDDAAWRLAWLYYQNGDLATAAAAFKNLESQSKNGPFAVAALYWQARITEKLGEVESGRQLHRQLIDGAAQAHYQMLSLRALKRLGDPVNEVKSNKTAVTPEADPPIAPDLMFHLTRARVLASLALRQLAVAELDAVDRQSNSSGALRALLMREYFQTAAYGRSLQLANQLPSSRTERHLYRYPPAFWDLIQKKAQDRDLDPYLVLGLIRQESLFDTRARSPATALGLMQLIPPTATRIAKQLGLPAPTQETLFEPETNLTLGTQYLKDLLQRYSNNWHKAIAAYNAGEAAVDRWEKEIVTDDIEEFVERIPYVETRGYVKLVLRNHQIYKRLYDTQK